MVFDRQHCTICPERSHCTKSLKAPRKLKLRPRDEYESLNARRQEQKTKEFKKKYSCRAGVEGTISLLCAEIGFTTNPIFRAG